MTDNKAFDIGETESYISFHSLNYSVKLKTILLHAPKKLKILHDVSGLLKGGLNAILGPSGGGKTTLLNLLAGRMDMSKLKGDILVDGGKQPANFKCLSGFVTQDDIVMGTLTVRENLMFSANMRLPKVISKKEKENKVEEILYELGLQSCADSKVGTALSRGISGGERKRTNIGMELIISPRVLFLDEPTTGLDSSTAYAVMQLLKTMSTTGRIIVFSIHQPSYNIFKYFDTMLLLSSGRVIYHGLSYLTLDYFQENGYECEEHNNPCDFFLDVANGDSTAIKALQNGKEELSYELNEKTSLSEKLNKEFLNSSGFKNLKMELDKIEIAYKKKRKGTKSEHFTYPLPFVLQLYYLSKRAFKNILRNPVALFVNAMTMAIMALIVGAIFFQLRNDAESGIQNRTGLLFFLVTLQVFRNIGSLELFINERVLFIHESTSGFYKVSAFFITKCLFDIIPMKLVPTSLLCGIFYFMVGFQLEVGKFFICYFTLVMAAISSGSLTFFVCTSSKRISTSHIKVAFTFIFMELFGGYLRNVTNIASWLSWVQYISIFRYSLKALYINELKDIKLYTNSTEVVGIGIKYLESQGIKYETAWDLWQNNLALFIISVVFLLLAYLQLLRKSKTPR